MGMEVLGTDWMIMCTDLQTLMEEGWQPCSTSFEEPNQALVKPGVIRVNGESPLHRLQHQQVLFYGHRERQSRVN